MLDVVNVSHSFGQKKVLSNISFKIEEGSILGLVGVNGAGKTTIIRLAVGLIQLSTGSIKVKGYSLDDNPQKYQSIVGAVLEGKQNLYPRMSVFENLKYFAFLRNMKRQATKSRIEELEYELNLRDFMNKEIYTLSSGMQQKAAIACSLIHDPELVFLDEPTLALDYQSSALINQYLLKLKKSGKSLLITSHDFNFLNDVVDNVIFLESGQVKSVQNIEDKVFKNKLSTYKIIIEGIHHFESEYIQLEQVRENNTELVIQFDGSIALSDILQILAKEKIVKIEKKDVTIKEMYLDMIGEQNYD